MSHVRFEAWTLDSAELSERRRRLMVGALAAATLSMVMGLGSWTAERLGITRVDPPKHGYAVTLQVLEPPPPPSPPPPVAGSVAADDDDDDDAAKPDDEVPPPPDDEVPTEVVKLDLDARPPARVPVPTGLGSGGGGPGNVVGIPSGIGTRCALPPCIGTQQVVGRPTIPQPKPPAAAAVHEPIERVMASSVFTPDPDQSRLARTPTGLGHRRPGKTTVAFCIDGSGKTYDVRVKRRFPGDVEVDEICRSTVARWRFTPQRVGGKARSTCSTVTFDIRFE